MFHLRVVLALWLFVAFVKGEAVVVGVIGDFGVAALGSSSAAVELSVANVIKRWQPDFIVTLGDNNYPDAASSTIDVNIGQFFAEYIHPYIGEYGPGGLTNRFFPCLGNHDWPAGPSLAYFTLPGNERYYTQRQGPVEFFMINSNADPDGTTATSVQGQWLQSRLAASTARWKLVVLHHPPYSSDRGAAGNPGFRWPFATWGAHAVFAGHDHIYARIHTNGIPYFINGLGGHAIDTFGSTNSAAAVRYRSDYGAMRLEATESNLICQFVSRGNVVADTLVLGSAVTGPIVLAPPLDQTVITGRSATFDVLASGAGTLRYQWQRNGTNIANATNRVLTLANVQIAQEGDYRVRVSSGTTTNASRIGSLTVARHPIILQHPANVSTGPGSNVTFRVAADGFGAIQFQWLRDGAELPGATGSNLVISNVQLEHNGDYAARVTDQMGATTSRVAELTVLARPIVTVHPLNQSGVVGETIVLSCEATGTLPLSFSWRKNRLFITNQIVDGNVSFFTLRNLQPTDAAGYQVGVTNIAGIAVGGISATGVVSVLADGDGDRMPDEWESAYSLSPSDPFLDFDDDGQPNLAEYLAGTDPTSAADRLKLWATLEPDGTTILRFNAVSNKTYGVEYCDSLHADEWDLLRELGAAPTNRSLSVTDHPPANRFYRVVTPNSQK
jgi:tartrate-resistant acid phosphatase type 5